MDREEEIRLIAYQIWEEEGYIHGLDRNHWQRAELILKSRIKQQNSSVDKNPAVGKSDKRKKKNTK